MLPEFYNQLGAMHGTIMVFLGRRAARRRRLRQLRPAAADRRQGHGVPAAQHDELPVLHRRRVDDVSTFFWPGGAAQSGWTSYHRSPTSSRADRLDRLDDPDHHLVAAGRVNFIDHDIQLRAKGMSFFRFPFFVWAQFVTAFLLLLAFPPLEVGRVSAVDGPRDRARASSCRPA
jgi:cytochrome c oxidase subunit 1